MTKNKKILFIASHPFGIAPSQRFRFEQYISFLNKNGFECKQSSFLSKNDYRLFYLHGHFFRKFWIILKGTLIRLANVLEARKYDIIFIQREATLLGTAIFETLFKKYSRAKLVFDFDDAIWVLDVSEQNKRFAWLKNPSKTSKIILYSDIVFAGNQYLFDFAKQYNKNVVMIPTTIDTEQYHPNEKQRSSDFSQVCIGWIGSATTIAHFHQFTPIVKKIKDEFGDRITFKVIGDGLYRNESLGIQSIKWSADEERHQVNSFDIGIMPLPDDQWARGKCGLKGLLYMALEIPPVMSPVGVNQEIVQDGINGFLAKTPEEWLHKLSLLIQSAKLREKMGKAARQTVIERYSVHSQKQRYLEYLNGLITNK